MSRLCCLVFLLLGLPALPAHAQQFGPPVLSDRLLVLLDREGHERFTLGTYAAAWETSPPVDFTVTVFSELLNQIVTGHFRRSPVPAGATPLLEGTYRLGGRWSLGFWYNQIRGDRVQATALVADVPVHLDLGRDSDLADLHITYSGPHGLSGQLGYYREGGTIRDLSSKPQPPTDYTQVSWNLWLTQRLDVFFKKGLVIDRLYSQLVPFLSIGYHPSIGLHHAASILAGLAITYRDKLSLSTSVWVFDLAAPSPAIRVTAGLVYRL